jgi:hypothetical protein
VLDALAGFTGRNRAAVGPRLITTPRQATGVRIWATRPTNAGRPRVRPGACLLGWMDGLRR